jgi:hypothetical protein
MKSDSNSATTEFLTAAKAIILFDQAIPTLVETLLVAGYFIM